MFGEQGQCADVRFMFGQSLHTSTGKGIARRLYRYTADNIDLWLIEGKIASNMFVLKNWSFETLLSILFDDLRPHSCYY